MPGRTKLRQGLTQTSKEEGGSTARTTAQIEKYHSGGKRKFEYKIDNENLNDPNFFKVISK